MVTFAFVKQLIFSIFSFVLVVQVFLGTTGVLVHEHHCKKDGTSRSFFITQIHERDVIQETGTCEKSSCCKSKEADSTKFPFLEKETCCSNSTDFIQLDTDLAVDNTELNHDLAHLATFGIYTVKQFKQTATVQTSYRGPPPLTTAERLANSQSYLI
jgi:hypothetical protein